MAKTTGSETSSRSADSSLPAPSIRHGLRLMSWSSAAVSRIECRSRYALATVTALNVRSATLPVSRRSFRHLHRSLVYVDQTEAVECRVQVVAQQPLVQPARPDLEYAVLQPLVCVVAERNAGVIRVDPLSASFSISQRAASALRANVCGADSIRPPGAP